MTYIPPTSTAPLPGGLTLTQFIQTILVGTSGLAGALVRPKWQQNPPAQPAIDTNWIAFAIVTNTPDSYAYLGVKADGTNEFQRHETLEIQCSFYGANSDDIAGLVRDGLQIPENLANLTTANIGYLGIDPARNVPDLVNERWVRKIEQTLFLRREIQRVYPILSIVSATGTIHTVLGDEEYLLEFATPAPPAP